MTDAKTPTFTEAEFKIMDVLWNHKSATVGEVTDALTAETRWAYTTVLTFLRILEQKGYVRHTKKGRAYVYHPTVDRQDARRHAMQELVRRFFDDSPRQLVLNLLEEKELGPEDLDRIRQLIDETDAR